MKILLTGSSGRIGRAIFGALAATHEVVGLDRSPFATTRIIADVTDRQAVQRAVRGVDAVIHTAALHAPHVGLVPDAVFQQINVEATRDIAHDARDWSDLQRAVTLLEAPTLTARMANLVGTPLEFAVKALPKAVSGRIHGAVQAALSKSAQAALWSMDNSPGKGASTRWHKLAAATSGAVGGAFGFAALFIELPVSTTIMMRAVADVARSEGFDLSEFSTRQACLEVFALGGNSPRDDASETGYYLARGFTTDVMRHLSAELAGRVVTGRDLTLGVAPKEAGKLLAKMVEKVAARFGVVVTEKFAAQAVPIVGAAAGATLNTMFTDYYQDMARGHFIVRRLERKYGEDVVRACYDRVAHGGVLIEPTL